MSTEEDMVCESCHGTLAEVGQGGRDPWLEEPTCTDAGCHGDAYQQDQALYRMSKEHGGVYCAACHDSPHAIAPSREYNDSIKFIGWQGHNGTLDICSVCHASWPTSGGPHDLEPPQVRSFTFEPDHYNTQEPGTQAVYVHTLRNTGNLGDSYDLDSLSSQSWASVEPPPAPWTLGPGETLNVTVTVTIPNGEGVRGLIDRTVVTATSTISATLVDQVLDWTMVPRAHIFLPIVLR